VQFDDLPRAEVFALDLRPDGEWSGEQAWVDAIDPGVIQPAYSRLRAIVMVLLLAMASGFLYEKASDWRDRRTYPQVGTSYDIGGRSLNLYCAGQGNPVVVMDSGANQPGYSWTPVQRGVSAFTRACWYDRAGYGWSDPAPGTRTSGAIAEDLHKLLHAAGERPPYVLVGHSFGGFNVRVFAGRYVTETAGLVLVDSASENEDTEISMPRAIQSPAARFIPRSLWRPLGKVASFLVHLGVARLLDDGPGRRPGTLSEYDWSLVHALRLQAKTFDASSAEGLTRAESVRQVKAVRNLGNVPLLVLTAARRFTPRGDSDEARALEAYYQYRVYRDQPRMLTLSTCARQVLVDSGHGMPEEAPDAVTHAVREVLADQRQ